MNPSPRKSTLPPPISILVWVLVSLAAGAAGGIASQPGEWYAALSKPSWNPPNWVFGPVWTTLYVMMGVAAAFAWPGRGTRAGRVGFALFGLQLALNALWSWIFFHWHRLDLAFVELTVLWVTILGTIIAFRRIRPLSGHLLLPYLAWVTFAGVLNFTIARLNPGGAPIEPAVPLVGVAAADCAPWDGAATSIYLSTSADPSGPPQLQLVVYLSGEGLPGRRIELGRQEAGSGIALHCESASSCTTSSAGVIEFASPAEEGILAGAYRVEFDDGVVAGTFRATWSRRVALCG
ncbi:MAG TPA: tryptophan-rich sensory protein [Gemmatimonadales bacterium]|nr:tryptophan-rich sensory protein [Gemmatimonadales bacterium]